MDDFSLRLCSGCNKTSASFDNKFFCDICYKALKQEFKYCRKHLGYDFFELDQILKDLDPVIYPKIFFMYKYDELTKRLVRNFKYRKPYYAKFFAQQLVDFFKENLSLIFTESKPIIEKNHTLLGKVNLFFAAVPLHEERLEKRTYNQAELLAQATYKEFKRFLQTEKFFVNYQSNIDFGLYQIDKLMFLEKLLIRKKRTESLFNKNKDQRLKILKNAFAINPRYSFLSEYKIENENVLIIFDDICTTGATFLEIFKLIKQTKLKFDEIIFLAATGRNL